MDFNASKKLSDFVWVNGEFVAWEDANIHALTHSLHYSGAVFEGERAYGGKVFKLMEHSQRLLKSAEYMLLKVDYSAKDIMNATEELLQKNNLLNAYIRPLIWRGAESMGIGADVGCNLLIMATDSNPPFKMGQRLCVSPWKKPSQDSMPPQSKSSAHYGMMLVSQKLAKEGGYDDAILLDQYDDIAECTTTNIFFAKEKESLLVTPIADRFLNGITRQTVIEIAKDMGIKVREERLMLEDLEEYDICFTTGTSGEIKGVSSIDIEGKTLEFSGEEIINKLQQEFAKIVGKEL